MTNWMKPMTAMALVLALAACGDSGESSKDQAAPAPEATAPEKSTMEKATEAAKDMATKAVESLKLDTSSLDAFKSSLANMKGSLSSADQSKLTEALATLAKDAAGDSKSGLMDTAKSMASGKSVTDTLYEKMGDKLDGMTFEDILALVG